MVCKNVHGKKCPQIGRNVYGKNDKEEKRPHKGGKNGHGTNIHVNNVQENASRNENSINSQETHQEMR